MTQTERLLAFLKAHPGCTAIELAYGLQPFVANPRARISDLRAAGHVIVCERDSKGVQRYHLETEPVQLEAWW